MPKQYKFSVFIFTRDLRLHDNTTLMHALKMSEHVIPIFIFNPDQVSKNIYKSNNCIQFMCECLEELSQDLKSRSSRLIYFYGQPDKIINSLLKNYDDIEAVFMNKDYTPFAVNREETIKSVCEKYKRTFESHNDYLLVDTTDVINTSGKPYLKFTPFMIKAKTIKIRSSEKNSYKNYVSNKFKFDNEYTDGIHKFYKRNDDIFATGGRTIGLSILKKIKNFKKYNDTRNVPSIGTTGLSAYLKFNVVSVRETYESIKNELSLKTQLITQLYWRDFYMIIMFTNPHVIGHNMNKKKIKWTHNEQWFDKWKNGETGIPFIDAGMRQLNKTGFMHNRLRMNVSCFLVKVMHIDWKKGEQYFAQNLVDYDPANNNGGWQWSASTGTDSQPYFRYFNPWAQGLKHDSDAEYIKKWIPELEDVSSKDIHKWYETYINYKHIKYVKPIITPEKMTEQIKETIKNYSSAY